MTEDDTYKRLRGLTRQEASDMYNYLYRIGIDSPETHTMGDVWDYVNEKLKPYGWTCDMLDNIV